MRQIRPTVAWLIPAWAAIVRVLQWVSPGGVVSSVFTMTGRVSQTAADLLTERGIDARSLTGGMKAWSRAWNAADVSTTPAGAHVIQLRRTGKGCLSYVSEHRAKPS